MASRWASSLCLQAGEGCRWLALHRLGAWPALVGLLLLALAALALPRAQRQLRRFALAAAGLVIVQVLLGILTLRLQLSEPLVTVAHQMVAALLVAMLGSIGGRSLVSRLSSRAIPVHPSLEMAHG